VLEDTGSVAKPVLFCSLAGLRTAEFPLGAQIPRTPLKWVRLSKLQHQNDSCKEILTTWQPSLSYEGASSLVGKWSRALPGTACQRDGRCTTALAALCSPGFHEWPASQAFPRFPAAVSAESAGEPGVESEWTASAVGYTPVALHRELIPCHGHRFLPALRHVLRFGGTYGSPTVSWRHTGGGPPPPRNLTPRLGLCCEWQRAQHRWREETRAVGVRRVHRPNTPGSIWRYGGRQY